MIRWIFRLPASAAPWTDADTVTFTRSLGRRPARVLRPLPRRPGHRELVTELLGTSPQFAEMWEAHEVEARRPMIKHVDHPLTGPIEFECHVLYVQETGQRLIIYCAAPGSPTQAAFRRLAQIPAARQHEEMARQAR